MMDAYRLRATDIEAFVSFCESQGWMRLAVPSTAWNQALRMEHADRRAPLIVYTARDAEFLTVYGESRRMLDEWGAVGGAWVEPSKPVQGRML